MKRINVLLLLLIVGELVVGGILVARRRAEPSPPLPPNPISLDPVTSADLQQRLARVHRPRGWRSLAEAWWVCGYLPEAEACFRIAHEKDPDNAELLFDWAFCLSRLGRPKEAIERYQAALEKNHPNPQAGWYLIARNHLRLENVDEAKRAFQKADQLPAARYELAWLAWQQRDIPNARQRLDHVLKESPNIFEPELLAYRMELEAGNRQKATQHREKMERSNQPMLNPFSERWNWLKDRQMSFGIERERARGQELMDKKEYEEAALAFQKVLDSPWPPDAAHQLADAKLELHQPMEAMRILMDLIERDGTSTMSLWRLGDALQAMGQTKQAGKAWKQALELRSTASIRDLLFELSAYEKSQGNETRSNFYLAWGLQEGGAEDLRNGNLERALKVLEDAVQRAPQRPASWFYLGEVHRAQGKNDEAKRAYERCLKIDPNHGRAIRGLSVLDGK